MAEARHIPLEGALNVRDLGGYTTVDGRTVAAGRLFRGAALGRATDADLGVLAGLGLKTVVDFRTPGEIASSGADRLPDGAAEVLLPVGGGNLDEYYVTATDAEARERLLGGGRAEQVLAGINRAFVAEDEQRAQFAVALALIADGGPLLFHCTAGKDRTGWLAAIVLTALDVPRDQVMADYLLSNRYFLPVGEAMLAKMAQSGLDIDPGLYRPLIEQRPAYLEAAFDEAEARYGSFAAFLAEGLDAGPGTVARLREALLD
ncbi:hypothetical protein Afil01_46760 [Actinorhabdospora filicis]|uniref:Tyrosine specific protein phosphatases domain-containing protein n=1 Tax=Actinorhabdospora filicis TaxID=1785913 RepID=A0A9W6SPY4_9ACTN|nr:tyrosine-protein phosphatase [Actinorhabdospora filicis]GLZ79869.1 hypothetical protein Afil01_46760 [Actinorhabdospora filicis]